MIETSIISYDKIKFPNPIYKYRSWSNPLHKEILVSRKIFMAQPTSFEDSKDCKSQKRYDLLTDKQIYSHFYQESKELRPYLNRQQHRSFARFWEKNTPIRNHDWVKSEQKKDFCRFDSRFGVLSLTSNCANQKMWDKYSDNNRGFCVGFDSTQVFKFIGGAGVVNYLDILPDILPTDSFDEEIIKQVFYKESIWSFEEEYRAWLFYAPQLFILPPTIEQRKIKLPVECYKEVIFGSEMLFEEREEVISICTNQGLPVEYFEVVRDNKTNLLSILPFTLFT